TAQGLADRYAESGMNGIRSGRIPSAAAAASSPFGAPGMTVRNSQIIITMQKGATDRELLERIQKALDDDWRAGGYM
ncbi:MAG: hypothetical protein ACO1SX_13735, partial [Actinomycetota bacterium]